MYNRNTPNVLIERIPELWIRTLAKMQVYFPRAQIAGGALRDLWHGKPVKDVDIFIPVSLMPDDLYEGEMKAVDASAVKIAASLYGQSGNTATPGFRNIYVIWSLVIEGETFEVIFIEDRGEDLISVFDLSLAQIGFDGKEVRYTENFAQTIRDKIIRVCNVNRSDRQTKRMERVLSKYPEYRAEQ